MPIVRGSLDRFLANIGESLGRIELDVTVMAWDKGSRELRYFTCGVFGAAVCVLEARGRVNGIPIHVDSRHSCRFGLWGGDSDEMRLRALQDCLWDVQQAMQEAGPGFIPSTAALWKNLRIARWAVFIVVAVAATIQNLFFAEQGIGGRAGFVLGVWGGLLLGALGFGTTGMLSLLLMPGDFYRNTAGGVRVIEKCGTRHVWALRLMAGIIGALLLAGFILLGIQTIRGT